MDAKTRRKALPGQLFVVATPIGHLRDITLRALDVLRSVDLIAAEDTRISRKLLTHYAIGKPMIAVHAHNETEVADLLLTELRKGKDVALLSDAGTPLISDPGHRLLSRLREEGIRIVPIPGPCSPIAALSASGFPADRFRFLGFLPRKGKMRKQLLSQIGHAEETTVLLESPHRLRSTLEELRHFLEPKRKVCVARELTKLHEEFIIGGIDAVIAHVSSMRVRGEIVLIIEPTRRTPEKASVEDIQQRLSRDDVQALPPSERAKRIAAETGVSKSEIYHIMLQRDKR